MIEVVEKWAEKHPKRTRQDKFLEHYPDAQINGNGIVDVAPCAVERNRFFKNGDVTCNMPDIGCTKCMREYWTEEIEE